MTTSDTVPATFSRATRGFIAVQVALLVMYYGALAIALGRAWAVTGHISIPYQGDQYDSLDFWPGGLLPLRKALQVSLLVTPFVAGILGAIGVTMVFDVPLSRRRKWTLVATSALALAAVVVTLVPPGRTIVSWLLD